MQIVFCGYNIKSSTQGHSRYLSEIMFLSFANTTNIIFYALRGAEMIR